MNSKKKGSDNPKITQIPILKTNIVTHKYKSWPDQNTKLKDDVDKKNKKRRGIALKLPQNRLN